MQQNNNLTYAKRKDKAFILLFSFTHKKSAREGKLPRTRFNFEILNGKEPFDGELAHE